MCLELRWKIRWQKEKNERKREAGWAERASSHTAHLKASATLAATPGSRRQVGSPCEKSRSPHWQLGEMTSGADTLPRLHFVLAGGPPPAIAGPRSERKAKRLEVEARNAASNPLQENYSALWNEPGVRYGGSLRRQEKKLMCDLIRCIASNNLWLFLYAIILPTRWIWS